MMSEAIPTFFLIEYDIADVDVLRSETTRFIGNRIISVGKPLIY
jgi:hypothetical protein